MEPSFSKFAIQSLTTALSCCLWLLHTTTGSSAPSFAPARGPWGQIESYETIIEPPAAYAVASYFVNRTNRWGLGLRSQSDASVWLGKMGLPEELIDDLKINGTWGTGNGQTWVIPPDSVIGQISPELRGNLYREVIATEKLNRLIIPGGNLRKLAYDLPEETIQLVESVLYLQGPCLCLSDLGYLLRSLDSVEKQDHLARVLHRVPALIPRLKVEPGDDLDAIADYWSANGRNPNARPILRGLRGATTTRYVDLQHLLPPTPRSHVNSFVHPSEVVGNGLPDCFWTATNFFNPTPQQRSLDQLPVKHFLEHFESVDDEESKLFGDVGVIFHETDDEMIHAFVYLADGLIFTKNGKNVRRPWIISRITDLEAEYAIAAGKCRVSIYRSPSVLRPQS